MNRFLQTVLRYLAPVAGVLLSAAMTAGGAEAVDCDRACFTSMITSYVDAVVAHDPSRLPLAAGLRFTEDSQELKLGEGLWKTVTRKGDFRLDYIDQKKQIAASHVKLFEENTPILYTVVLRIADQKIAGIETLVDRVTPTSHFKPDSLDKPMVGMNEPVPAGQRMPRAEMIRTALHYSEGLRIGGIENGNVIAGVGCSDPNCPGLLTQKIMPRPDVKPSVAAVDEEEGIVLLWTNFGDTNSYGPGNAL